MAVIKDATSLNNSGGWENVISVLHTATGTNRLLIVGAGADTENVQDRAFDSVTFGGELMTYLTRVYSNNQTDGGFIECWYMKEADLPASGVEATILGTLPAACGEAKSIVAVSLTGVDQTTPLDAPVVTYGSSDTPSVDVATVTGEMIVNIICDGSSFVACAQTPNFIHQERLTFGAGATGLSWQTGNGTLTSSWTHGSDWWGSIGVNVNAAGGSASPAVKLIYRARQAA